MLFINTAYCKSSIEHFGKFKLTNRAMSIEKKKYNINACGSIILILNSYIMIRYSQIYYISIIYTGDVLYAYDACEDFGVRIRYSSVLTLDENTYFMINNKLLMITCECCQHSIDVNYRTV